MRIQMLLLALLSACLCWGQEIEVRGHVADAENDDPMPFVSITSTSGNATMTNYDGDFTIKADPQETIKFACVGFETQTCLANKVPKVIRLKSQNHSLREVRVISWENVLVRVAKQLNKQYNRRKKNQSKYFYRLNTTIRHSELVEAFVEARSAVNLREITFLRGRRGQKSEAGLRNPFIANMNFHHPMELGPLVYDSRFWMMLKTPLTENTTFRHFERYYDISGEELLDEQGNVTYRIEFKKGAGVKSSAILSGVLYVDAKTLRPLRFDGQVENVSVDVKRDFKTVSSPIDISLHVDYRYNKGCTQVQDISCLMESGDLRSQALLYNVDDLKLKVKKGKKTAENMLTAIDQVGFDSTLWAMSDIVRRTDAEERIFQGQQSEAALMGADGDQPIWHTDPRLAVYAPMLDRLSGVGRQIPQEKVYLHMDNTTYFVGDTLWFSAYTRQTNNDMPSKISGVLYVELYNQDGYMMERKLIEMDHGRGHGNFVLKPDYYGGFYELRAYTRWQLNWGVTEHPHRELAKYRFINEEMQQYYYRDYEKLYSRVFPVYDAPKEPGEYVLNMTTRAMRRYFRKEPHKRRLQLSFYPEGGNLVVGLPSRVAFEATWDDGEQAPGTLYIGQDSAVVLNRGRGVFEYTPMQRDPIKVTFLTADGKKETAKLPEAEPDGATMQVGQQGDQWTITTTLSSDLIPDSMALTIMHQGVLHAVYPLVTTTQRFTLSAQSLPAGVCQATLFDLSGRVLADRLFFVNRPGLADPNIRVTGKQMQYEPFAPVQLQVSAPAPRGSVSLAVRDISHSDVLFDDASIQAEMLLSSEIKGFVPNPGWFFESDDEEHRTALDLLMMTQGWRRFNWRDMAVRGVWDLSQPDERTPVLTGTVYHLSEEPYYGPEAWGDYFAEPEPNSEGDVVMNRFRADAQALANESVIDQNSQQLTENPDASSTYDPSIEENSDPTYDWQHQGKAKRDVLVHAEIVSVFGNEQVTSEDGENEVTINDYDVQVVEKMTQKGKFRILLPEFYGQCIFFIGASDSSKWNGKPYAWCQKMPSVLDLPASHPRKARVDPAEYAVRIQFPYPRFVKPYSFYQSHLSQASDPLGVSPGLMADGAYRLNEVEVRTRRGGLHKIDDSQPALVLDAMDVYNEVLDAGMGNAEIEDVVRTYLGDYGLEFPYVNHDDRISFRAGMDNLRRSLNDYTLNPDSVYQYKNLHTMTSTLIPPYQYQWSYRSYFDKYIIYTDYCPRLEGDERYKSSNLPETNVAIFPFVDGHRRNMYRDRRYVLTGFSNPDDFYHPNYSNYTPVADSVGDYRRTLYWNPDLRLDDHGKAQVQFYNNGQTHPIAISVQGMGTDGTALSGKE